MLTFTDTPVTKPMLIVSLERHAKLDAIVQGTYGEEVGDKFVACAVGCSLHDFNEKTNDHAAYERLFGVPRVLARLEDGIFEELPEEDATKWPLRFAQAIPVGRDLAMVWPRFAVWMLVDPKWGVLRSARTDAQKHAIREVADLYTRQIEGEKITEETWSRARRDTAHVADAANARAAVHAAHAAAHAAYAAAARDAARADAANARAAVHAAHAAYAAAARDAARADVHAAHAAYAAAYAADADATRHKNRQAQADKLVQLLKEA